MLTRDALLQTHAGHIHPLYFILVDISGYTRFIRFHRISLLHAEKIIAELMESILKEVKSPVIAHEILGDAISLYAIDQGKPEQADEIYSQIEKYIAAFREREASLISECSICECDACKQVGQLKLKTILHHGQAAFTRIRDVQKISGEDVILSHRLLKNNVASDEYILMTGSFVSQCKMLDLQSLTAQTEIFDETDKINVWVKNLESVSLQPARLKFSEKLRSFWMMDSYLVRRIFSKRPALYRNLPVT